MTILGVCRHLPSIAQLVGRAARGSNTDLPDPQALTPNWGELGYLLCQLNCSLFQTLLFTLFITSMCLGLCPFPD